MESQFKLYIADTETTGLKLEEGAEIIEISFLRINDDSQKTWFLRPEHPEKSSSDALRINGHKIEDLQGLTKDGKEKYITPSQAIIEIENWFMEDSSTPDCRILIGQNIGFDLGFLEDLWRRNKASETFPFGTRPHIIDTKQIQLFIDLIRGEKLEYYNLGSLVEWYGVKKLKAHRATEDTKMTRDVFLKQMERFNR